MSTTDGPIAAATANHAAGGDPAKPSAPFPAGEEPAWALSPPARRPARRAGGEVALRGPSAQKASGDTRRGPTAADRSTPTKTEPRVFANGAATGAPPVQQPLATSESQTTVDATFNPSAATAAPRTQPIGIVAAASQPIADPCDVAVDAMPAHLVGDLTPPEDDWLLAHTSRCNYCRNVLNRYHRVDEMLDRLHRYLDPLPVPPPFRPPAPARTARRGRLAAPAVPVARRRAAYGTLESPVGPLRVAVSDAGVCEIGFATNESEAEFRAHLEARGFTPEPCLECALGPEAVARVTRQLEEYFNGRRDRFDLPLDFSGVSPFTRSVLAATTAVPFGHLATYRDIARQIGAPSATRAVGNALGRNPIPVIVPCHRIVRSDATLGGYTGGLGIKQRLLAIEGIAPPSLGLQ